MNGYDFDDTIYKGNSFRRFFLFCLVRLPYLIVLLPVQIVCALLRACHAINHQQFLSAMNWFVYLVPNRKWFVGKFWDKEIARIKPWYLAQQRSDDIVVSASPRYEVQEICNRLGIATLIATETDNPSHPHNGVYCYEMQKAVRYKQQFGDTPLETYYSDSVTDIPMFMLAKRGYYVDGNNVVLYYENGKQVCQINEKKAQKVRKRNGLN